MRPLNFLSCSQNIYIYTSKQHRLVLMDAAISIFLLEHRGGQKKKYFVLAYFKEKKNIAERERKKCCLSSKELRSANRKKIKLTLSLKGREKKKWVFALHIHHLKVTHREIFTNDLFVCVCAMGSYVTTARPRNKRI